MPEYVEFTERVEAGLVDGEEPHLSLVDRVYPLIANELQTLSRTVTGAEALIRLEITREQRSMAAALQELREQRRLLEGLNQGLNRRLYINHWSHERIQEAESRLATAGLALPPIIADAPLTTGDLVDADVAAAAATGTATALPPNVDPPSYTMIRTHATVTDLWQEWSVGWGGRPSIQSLDDA